MQYRFELCGVFPHIYISHYKFCVCLCAGLQPSLSKIASLSKLFQSSCSFKHAFQRVFGSKKTSAAEIPSTAWNHRLQQMQYMLSLDQQKLNKICKTTRNKAYMLSPSDWNRLKELVDILAPFAEAASAVQQSSEPAISFVLPTVLELHNRLLSFIEKKQHLRRLGADMLLSLKNHFKGIFATVGLSGESDRLADDWSLRCSHPYGNPVYVVASVLDPRFCFNWIAHVHEDEATKDNIKQRIEGSLCALPGLINSFSNSDLLHLKALFAAGAMVFAFCAMKKRRFFFCFRACGRGSRGR